MGTDYSVYVGPFLKCKNSKADRERTIRACTKKSCKNYKDECWDANKKFCELCGSVIGDVVVKYKGQAVDTNPEIVDEALMPYNLDAEGAKGYDIWMGNLNDGVGVGFSPKYDGEQYMEMSTGLIMEEIQKFMEFYKKPIAKLTELYGKENIEVKWGLIHEIN